ncbi:MAG: hypothetical protein ABFS46_01645 [Myxococcota bacterium]
MQRLAAAALAALPLLLAGGLRAEPDPVAVPELRRPLDLWPLVVRDGRPVAGSEVLRAGGPLFERWREPRETGWTLRPLLAGIQDAEREEERLEFLYPLGEWERGGDGTSLRLTPLLDGVQRPEEEGEKRGWTFGLAFGGRTDAGEGYFGVFPLGGVAKQRFGLERLDFWLFPLFARSRDASGYTKTHVLWPLFSFGSGGGRRTVRIWPFYGHDVREGHFDRRFALWPFVHWRTERPGDPTLEQHALFVLPFYGRTERPQARSHFVLGPLYMRAENDLTGATQTDLLWPFLRYAQRPARDDYPGSRELRLEPFYRRTEGPGFRQSGSLLGAIRRTTVRRDDLEVDAFRLLFVSRVERSLEPDTGRLRLRSQVWPFYRRVETRPSDAPARGSFQAPWILPFAGDGWLRHSLGLFTFYERRWQDGESRSDWLWGLARARRAPGYRLDALSWLYRRESSSEGRRLRVLGMPFDSSAPAPLALPTLTSLDAD